MTRHQGDVPHVEWLRYLMEIRVAQRINYVKKVRRGCIYIFDHLLVSGHNFLEYKMGKMSTRAVVCG